MNRPGADIARGLRAHYKQNRESRTQNGAWACPEGCNQPTSVRHTNGTSLSVDDAAAGSSLHQITYVDTQCFGYS